MSNPCINRWGLNSIWYHSWYSDSRYAFNLQHDKLALELIQVYLKYGNAVHAKLFWNCFWYKTGTAPTNRPTQVFYRWATVYNETLRMTSTYRMRITSEEVFQTQISVLKFDSWMIVNFYWFQPDKDKKKRARRAKLKRYTSSVNPLKRSITPLKKISNLVRQSLPNAPHLHYTF